MFQSVYFKNLKNFVIISHNDVPHFFLGDCFMLIIYSHHWRTLLKTIGSYVFLIKKPI